MVRRLAGTDDVGRFELAEDLSGNHHHHHLMCSSCGVVADVGTSPALAGKAGAPGQQTTTATPGTTSGLSTTTAGATSTTSAAVTTTAPATTTTVARSTTTTTAG